MRVHLIRHGETNWNKEKRVQGHSESTLTPQGQQQARDLAPTLRQHPITKVYCSSSIRTRQTCELLFSNNPIETLYNDELREIYLGPWEGKLQSEIRSLYPEQFENFFHAPEQFAQLEAETFEEVQQRGLKMLKQILSDDSAQEVAIVSHGVLIKSLLCYLENRPLAQLWEPPIMHNCAHSIIATEPNSSAPRILQFAGLAQ
ncbi:MAG: histidine phosphatase family protein [Gammaproteobacteria bacterium]